MTNLPPKIYLQFGEDGDADYKDCKQVTFSDTKVYSTDAEYILSSVAQAEIERLMGLLEQQFMPALRGIGHNFHMQQLWEQHWQQFKQQNNL